MDVGQPVHGAVGTGAGPGYYRGGVWLGRWVGGLYRYPAMLLGERLTDSGAGPVAPAGGGVGGQLSSGARSQETTTPLRSGPAPLSPGTSPGIPASGPIRARFHVKYSKVSQNG